VESRISTAVYSEPSLTSGKTDQRRGKCERSLIASMAAVAPSPFRVIRAALDQTPHAFVFAITPTSVL
jgi:hypothetical protein